MYVGVRFGFQGGSGGIRILSFVIISHGTHILFLGRIHRRRALSFPFWLYALFETNFFINLDGVNPDPPQAHSVAEL